MTRQIPDQGSFCTFPSEHLGFEAALAGIVPVEFEQVVTQFVKGAIIASEAISRTNLKCHADEGVA
jgi:hypothetical protein